jgi:hypothetical protein
MEGIFRVYIIVSLFKFNGPIMFHTVCMIKFWQKMHSVSWEDNILMKYLLHALILDKK